MPYVQLLLTLAYACSAGCDTGPPHLQEEAARVATAAVPDDPGCDVVERRIPLPEAVRESSGLARSARDAGLFWTHNDAGGDPELFAVDVRGRLVARVAVTGAGLVDWEDLEAAPCPAGTCLYIGDIGDNDGDRDRITVYRIAEPSPRADRTGPAEAFHARFPDGPRDAEALFAGPGGALYVVTKGRGEEVGLYRWRLPDRAGATVTLEPVRTLFPRPDDEDDRVTGATATPDGRWVGIRSYRTLYLYPLGPLVGGHPVEPRTFDLAALDEPQGEAVVVADDGSVWLSSEAGDGDGPRLSALRCATEPEGSGA